MSRLLFDLLYFGGGGMSRLLFYLLYSGGGMSRLLFDLLYSGGGDEPSFVSCIQCFMLNAIKY